MQAPELMLLGGPNSGKTHYAGQLYGRLRRNPGLLRLRDTPLDLSLLEEVLRCLSEGRAAEHTAADTWGEVLFPLEDERGNALDLRWPDYGGEQLRRVFNERAAQEKWRTQLREARGWLLLIRLKGETVYRDALQELIELADGRNGSTERASKWDANAYWVELLQILLYVAGLGTVVRRAQPRLAVLLSCYDELEGTDGLQPRQVLAQQLPLVASFIDSAWFPNAVSVWGLSALGRHLEKDSTDELFIDDGPQFQGWIIAPEGGQPDPDLSRPVAWLLGEP
ncbi:hypothetical protein SAMN02949497_1697 [Methylomagnum ishizawai]|uniref:Double-GTPase 1 domain-containing protein n=1 Tax=Methylomagnum ishizawai TaxID=1760988 RepID=A0A1Y6D1W3_9GAMM|nr:hypothetical protein [Methylomagnum ishizawai]SMF94384.1 hypothetical protein SAMN02949497_1697 [Methylomagnum ishizawai]